jgi:predicted component of type VI protein secretion system
MQLRLILRGPTRLLNAIPEASLTAGSLIIGRSPDADWTIDDPERVLSKAHCRIDRTDRGFTVVDTSTNGVRINNVAIPRGLPTPLGSGDILMLGDALISAEILTGPLAPPANDLRAFAPAPPSPPPPVAAAPNASASPPPVFAPPPPAVMPAPVAAVAPPPRSGGRVTAAYRGPFDSADETPVAASEPTVAVATPTAPPAAVQADWWDPDAVSGKARLTSYERASVPGPVSEQTGPAEAQPVSADMSPLAVTLSQLGADVDAKILAGAVQKAVMVLSEDERKKFDERLGEILREEVSRWS